MVSIAFTGGGTGGHIYPGLAVADELKKRLGGDFRLFWIGSSAGMDRSLVEEAGIEFFGIPSGKLRRYFSIRTAIDFFKVIAGFFAAKKILKKQKARLLFSKGGFVSVPPCAAASSLKIPVFTHESDFSPGLATKINARFVMRTKGKILTAYENTAGFFPQAVRDFVMLSGNPVRSIFYSADAAKGRAFLGVGKNARILLVLGGSQGARQINELLRAILPELTKTYTVVHQTGANQQWDLAVSEMYKPYPFIREELPHVMAAAEFVLSRSGAGIWECAVLGKPMLLIPLEGSARGDQLENACYFREAEAALVFAGDDANPDTLLSAIKLLEQDAGKRAAMAAASSKLGKRDGTGFIAQTLAEEVKKVFGG
ncbi:MAG: undecaprenyldiphospho-muramoylpentapeptide beta-N-acetylglucosaminyltransferase [Treponema sp.]|jgi:UDP-N-acetylglucosamine--N-acetylmuramyl-(pentapeptide) pyrophosphoryl-undecaprenol N-acetylglucosamine transferase|nr:undecaprenyldiphospho-muramoylpentapeptide beta-N-acetylglucosaminyltransferase [Treponema sp.]